MRKYIATISYISMIVVLNVFTHNADWNCATARYKITMKVKNDMYSSFNAIFLFIGQEYQRAMKIKKAYKFCLTLIKNSMNADVNAAKKYFSGGAHRVSLRSKRSYETETYCDLALRESPVVWGVRLPTC